MRSTSALYRHACDEEGCVSHSELVKLFHGIDVALGTDADATTNANDMTAAPQPPALADKMLLAYAPNLCFPTHLTLSQSYLGDTGLAAFMRMLPMLRWVRVIEARGVGAGPRTIEALSAALTAYLVEGCEEAAALPTVATMGDSVSGAEQLAGGRLPALELVDLRDSNGIYALSGQRLLTALRKRRLMLRAWCAAHAGVGDVVPALEVLVDLDALPPSTANALHEWNEEAANIKYQRMLARETHRWQEQVQVFTVRSAVSEAMKLGDSDMPDTAVAGAAARQPVGEHVIFRLPSSADGDSQTAQMTCEVNACMSDFLTASCCLSSAEGAAPQPAHVVSGYSSLACPLPTLDGVRAALQVCIDFGADTLAILPHTNAALWYVASVWQQQQQKQHTTTPSSSTDTAEDVQLNYWEAKANVAALLRGLQANPALETELETSTQAGGIVIQRHLYRLRQLYVQLDQNDAPHENAICTARVAEAGATPLGEMVALYYRIVAALVTRRFSETHLPSMRACEQHISDVTEHVLSHLVVGEESSEALEARIERLRWRLRSSSDAGSVPSGRPAGDSGFSQSMRALPPVMARCLYHLRRHQAEGEAWVKTYAGTAVAAPQLSSSAAAAPIHAFHACHCADGLRRHMDECAAPTSSNEGLSSNLLPLPCTSCCYHALQAAQTLLQSPGEESSGESELCARWAILEPVRRALPRELRMFFLDMVIRHRSRVRGGCAYVPSLDSVAGAGAPLPVSMVDWLAYTEHQGENWAKVLRVFGEWYRLRALESYGIAEARTLLRQPPT
ncbi:protein of unknown function - conserved [Leishmania donovani]|uniref:Hypothetical_protein_conserved n=1 Tax=Leishmania donovani TaxID=5661 RepID=A0A6J8FH17_LEIDO|nr:protein of unknown function - conserved [Leishmania donovani]VDZ45148.1 hypothetical_protein_conserved [Leishmania donovani]